MLSEARACCNLTRTQNNLQQTANNKTCREQLPIKPNLIDAHSMVYYTTVVTETSCVIVNGFWAHWTPFIEKT